MENGGVEGVVEVVGMMVEEVKGVGEGVGERGEGEVMAEGEEDMRDSREARRVASCSLSS
jgi:hypothetical protein